MTKIKRLEFSVSVKKKVMERSGNRCERCGIDFDEDFKGEFHHIVPVLFGGVNSDDNCSLLCFNCHRMAPNIKNKDEIPIYHHYFIRFASFKEAAEYYDVDNRFDLYIKVALDIATISQKRLSESDVYRVR